MSYTLNIDRISVPKEARNGRIYANGTGSNSGSNNNSQASVQNLQDVVNVGNISTKPLILKNTAGTQQYTIYVDDNGHLRFSGAAGTAVISDGDVIAYTPQTLPVENAWSGLPVDNTTIHLVNGVLTVIGAPNAGVSSWTELADKPTWLNFETQGAFEGGHGHDWSKITGKPAFFDGTWNSLTGKPTIPSLTGYATESYVNTQVANLVASAPTTLDTLNELATALGNDPNFATTTANLIGQKQDSATAWNTGNFNPYQSISDFNAVNESGAFYANVDSAQNRPASVFGAGFQFIQATNSDYMSQLAFDVNGNIFKRFKYAGNWSSWETIWHSENLNRSDIDFTANNIIANGDVTAYSDISLKENLNPLTNVLSKIDSITGYAYNRKDKEGKKEIGLIAQELERDFPELVHINSDKLKSVDYMKFTAVLLQAVKELNDKVCKLERRHHA
jgi:hypothetical protein